ncbi:MAG: DUF3078 domain-containing protein [Spirosomataceae bacterium]
MKKILLFALGVLGMTHGWAQDPFTAKKSVKDTTYFVKSGQFGANFNQASFSSNWAGGGVNSIAFGIFLNAKSEKAWGRNLWTNDFQSQFGVVKAAGQGTRKSIDRIFFDSKYARRLSSKWNLFGSFNFLSQFADGFEYTTVNGIENRNKISGLFSPAFLTEAIGLEYRPVPFFFVQFAPGAIRQTVVADKDLYKNFPKNYGVTVGKTVRNEVALMQIVANFDKNIAQNVNLKLRYLMYTTYTDLAASDVRLDALLSAKINKYMSATAGLILVYDQDQSYQTQVNQALSLGFAYNF